MRVLNIFVVEDNPADVLLLREILSGKNVVLDVRNTGEEAIEFITNPDGRANLPDMFVIDMRMARVGGLDVARSIREKPQFSTRPIVLLSSLLSPAQEIEVETIPFSFFFKKPASLEEWFKMGEFIRSLGDESIGRHA